MLLVVIVMVMEKVVLVVSVEVVVVVLGCERGTWGELLISEVETGDAPSGWLYQLLEEEL